MILNDSELELRLTSPDNLLNRIVKRIDNLDVEARVKVDNSNIGTPIPQAVRELMGVTSLISNDTRVATAAAFGVSRSSLIDFETGMATNKHDKESEQRVKEAAARILDQREVKKDEAHDLALDAMVGALTGLKARISEVDKPKDLARIASDMSKISNNLSIKNEHNLNINKVQVITFAPNIKNEKLYEVLEVGS